VFYISFLYLYRFFVLRVVVQFLVILYFLHYLFLFSASAARESLACFCLFCRGGCRYMIFRMGHSYLFSRRWLSEVLSFGAKSRCVIIFVTYLLVSFCGVCIFHGAYDCVVRFLHFEGPRKGEYLFLLAIWLNDTRPSDVVLSCCMILPFLHQFDFDSRWEAEGGLAAV